jgi:hypothetical protein
LKTRVRTHEVLESVEGLDVLALSLVLGCELLSFTYHVVDLLLTEKLFSWRPVEWNLSHSQALILGELKPRRCDTVTLVVGNDFDASTPVHTGTRVGGTQVDTDDSFVVFIVVSASNWDEADEDHNGE